MRTIEEIINRINEKESVDLFGIQKIELFTLLPFENAKYFLGKTYVSMMETSTCPAEEVWIHDTDVKNKMINFLPFAYNLARAGKTILSERCLLHFKVWIWYDDPEFFSRLEKAFNECDDCGIEIYDAIISHYELTTPIELPASLISNEKTSPDEEI